MESSKVEEMSGRIVGLEAEVRRLRRLVAIPIIATLILGGYAGFSRARAGRALVVGSVEIRDNEGRLRGSLGLDRYGLPGLRLYDHRGSEQVVLEIPSDDASGLFFLDRGALRVAIESSIEGSASLRLLNQEQKIRASLDLAPDGTSELILADSIGEKRLGVRPEGESPLATGDLGGRAGASTSGEGHPTLGRAADVAAPSTTRLSGPGAANAQSALSSLIRVSETSQIQTVQPSTAPLDPRLLGCD
jgi:hypothetical protein